MYKNMKHIKGFTLIETVFVLLILAILVGITVPLSKTIINRMIAKEAIGTLRAILAAEKVYFSKYGTYTNDLSELGFSSSELDGVYFSEACYTQYDIVWGGYGWWGIRIRCAPAASDPNYSPKANVVKNWGDDTKYIGINLYDIIHSNLEWLGYEEFGEWEFDRYV